MLLRSLASPSVAFIVAVAAFGAAGCVPPASPSADESSGALTSALTGARSLVPGLRADGDVDGYLGVMHDVVQPWCLPFLQNRRFAGGSFGDVVSGSFTGAAGRTVAYAVYRAGDERAALVLLPGFQEPFAKYCEVIDDLHRSGISVYAMDLRGQGWSQRLTADPEKGYLDAFDAVVADVETFRARIVNATPHAHLVLFGHSTGGAAATLYLEKHAHDFDAAILSSPMHEINTAPYPAWFAGPLADTLWLAGRGTDYAPGRGPYDEGASFVANGTEHSIARWLMARQLLAEHPELKLGGATVQWVHEALAGTARARANAGAIATPFLLLQARHDEVVLPGGQETVCRAANRNGPLCTLVRFGDATLTAAQCDQALAWYDLTTASRCAGHELLMEQDVVRDAVEQTISGYLARY
jgi:lysophospholipase